MTYNLLNLPVTATKTGLALTYTYDAAGRKLRKVNTAAPATSRHYVDGIEYNGNTIEIIQTEEGIARNNGGTYSYEYNLTDHLGNVRYTFNKHPTTGVIQRLQADNYYAFGKRKSVAPVSLNNKYLYNVKEVQDELGEQYDYSARFYDPVIGRWNVIDPLAEIYEDLSPYNYALNNPSRFIDPDGMGVEDKIEPPEKKPIQLKEVDPLAEDYMHLSPYNYVFNNPISNVDPDGRWVNTDSLGFKSTFVDASGKIIKHVDDKDRNIYLVPDPSKWDGSKQDLTIIGREKAGVDYNFHIGRKLNKVPFENIKVELHGKDQDKQFRLAMIILNRFGTQSINQSFILDGILFPELNAYFKTVYSLDQLIVLSKGGKRNIWPDEYGYPPNVNDVDWKGKSDSELADAVSKAIGDTKRGPTSSNNLAKKWFRDKCPK